MRFANAVEILLNVIPISTLRFQVRSPWEHVSRAVSEARVILDVVVLDWSQGVVTITNTTDGRGP